MPRKRYRSDELQNDVWTQNETTLRRLYLIEHKTLKDVKKEMEAEHGFPTTPLSTYESKLRDLGLRKKMKRKDWRPVYQHYVNSGGQHTALFLNGARIPWDRAWKEIRRSGARDSINEGETNELPTDVIMRTPSPVLDPQRIYAGYGAPAPWHLSNAPLDGLSLDAIFRRLTLYDIPSNLVRITMLSELSGHEELPTFLPSCYVGGLQPGSAMSRTEVDGSSCNHRLWPNSTNQSIEYILPHQSSTVSHQGSNPTSANSVIDRLSTALYWLANHEVWWSREGPLPESLDVVFNLTPKHVLLKILKGDSPTVRAATEALVEFSVELGRQDDFRNIVEAVGRYHPEWIRPGWYLLLAARVGCTDTCRLLLRVSHPPKYGHRRDKFVDGYCDAVLESIAYEHFECAKFLCQHLMKSETTLSREDSTATGIFARFLHTVANVSFTPKIALPPCAFSLRKSCVRQMLDWVLEAGANVDVPAPIPSYDMHILIYRYTPEFLKPTILDYAYLNNSELYSLIASHSVKSRAELTRSGVCSAASEGFDSLRLYLLSRHPQKRVLQSEFLGILLTEELLKPVPNKNLDFNVVYTLLHYNRSLPNFGSELNVSAMLYCVVRASRRQGMHLSTLHIIQTLARKGAVIVAETMAEAIEEEGTSLLQLLSSTGADFKNYGALALCGAMRCGNYDAVSWLLDTGVDVNATLEGHGDEKDITVLARANCYDRNVKCVNLFGYDFWVADFGHSHPMNCAMLEFLISRNVRLRAHSSDRSLRELLYITVTNGLECNDSEETIRKVQVLLDAEIITDDQSGTEPCLLEACFHIVEAPFYRDLDLLELFLDYGISTRYSGVLACLIRCGAPTDKIKRVLDSDADVNAYYRKTFRSQAQQRTPLQEAARVGSLDLVQLLMQKGAHVNQLPKGYSGRTALQSACENEILYVNIRLIKLLIENGAEVNAPPAPSRGVTAFQAAAMTGNFEVALLLLDHGADINAPPAEEEGLCALDGAAAYGRLDMVQFLLDLGALSHDRGESGYRGAIREAELIGERVIADMIRQYALKTGKSGEELSANYEWEEEEENSGTENDSDEEREETEGWEI